MRIQLKLMGVLKDRTPADGSLTISNNSTIKDALVALEIDVDSVHVFTVNGSLQRDKTHVLAEGDELAIFPPVGGG